MLNDILTKKVVVDGITRTVLAQIPGERRSGKLRKSTFVTDAEVPAWFREKWLAKKLYHYQLEIVEHHIKALNKYSVSLDASDMGVGKTYSALAAAIEMGLTPHVVTLKPVIPSWRAAANMLDTQWASQELHTCNYEAVRGGKSIYGTWVAPTGRKRTKSFKWNLNPTKDVIIFDEVHWCSGENTLNSKLLKSAVDSGCRVILLSGTVADQPKKLSAIGYALGLHDFQGFYGWLKGCCGYTDGKFGLEWSCGLTWPFDPVTLDANRQIVMQNIHKQVFGTRGIRLSTSEIPDFPESQITSVPVDFGTMATDKLNDIYAKMEAELLALYNKKAKDIPAAMTIITRARQEAELLKVPVMLEEADDAIQQGMSVVIFVNYNATIDAMLNQLGSRKAGVIRGGQNNVLERAQYVADFQADKLRLLIANEAAGGTGMSFHDLHGRHPRLALISPNYNAVTLKQVARRVWRAGGKTKSIQKILFAANTVEEKAQQAAASKCGNIDALNGADLTSGLSGVAKHFLAS